MRPEVRFDLLNGHIVISKVDRSTCELLSVDSNIHAEDHSVLIVFFNVRNESDNLAVFVETFGTSPFIVRSRLLLLNVLAR